MADTYSAGNGVNVLVAEAGLLGETLSLALALLALDGEPVLAAVALADVEPL